MPSEAGEKTEAPTPRRLQEARQKGQVAKSNDLTAAVGLLVGLVMLYFYGPTLLNGFLNLLNRTLGELGTVTSAKAFTEQGFHLLLRQVASLVGPFLLIIAVAAAAINLMQVGFLFTTQPMTPSLDKISPLAGFKRLFSARTAMRLAMSLLKVAVITLVAFIFIRGDMPRLVNLSECDFTTVIHVGAFLTFKLGLRLAFVLLVLALLDYAYQKYRTMRDLRMSREELKEELKRMEGDPIMRQRRRAVARQLAAQRMSQAVPRADVVITNPTHLAVALKYDHESMPAPKVVARGAGYIAQRIREIADEHGVPIVERKPLAQALYKSCEVGDYVPPELYKAVAEVLAYVFELAGKGFRRSRAG
ncbi:MAG: flagellar biosynthesis protein FlhB [Sedimentisphaerales bacterium]|nr:flagellar biosynthesis protein FlhB [Sedimentisphaerales bacterium]